MGVTLLGKESAKIAGRRENGEGGGDSFAEFGLSFFTADLRACFTWPRPRVRGKVGEAGEEH